LISRLALNVWCVVAIIDRQKIFIFQVYLDDLAFKGQMLNR
jgi:hypothetical protein